MRIESAIVNTALSRSLSSHPSNEPVAESDGDNRLRGGLQSIRAGNTGVSADRAENAADGVVFSRSDRAAGGAVAHIMLEGTPNLERIQSVFSRLNTDQQQRLIDLEIFNQDRFLNLAEQLDDKQLNQLMTVVDGLQTPPELHGVRKDADAGAQTALSFMGAIAEMDAASRSRMLEKASDLAAKVAPYTAPDTYPAAVVPGQRAGSVSANDLHSFAFAIAASDDPNTLLDQLETFDEPQQSRLLMVLGADLQQGHRLMTALEGRNSASQDAVLNFLPDWIDETRLVVDVHDGPRPLGTVWTTTDFDNISAAPELVENTLALMEQYRFSDEQLQDMADQLAGMGRSDQRAYLSITVTGLEHLVGGSEQQPVDLSDRQRVLDTLDSLRNSNVVRDAVFESRMGEQTGTATHPYEYKDYETGQRDQQQMIQLLVTDAWLHKGDSARPALLASRLSETAESDTEGRNQFVRKLNAGASLPGPMADQSDAMLQTLYTPLLDRTDTLVNTTDLNSLFAAEQSLPDEMRDAFWQVTAFAEANVDRLSEVLLGTGDDTRQLIVETLAEEIEQIAGDVASTEGLQERLQQLMSYFDEPHTTQEQAEYLAWF